MKTQKKPENAIFYGNYNDMWAKSYENIIKNYGTRFLRGRISRSFFLNQPACDRMRSQFSCIVLFLSCNELLCAVIVLSCGVLY